jgi:DNA mismatch repair ATPase MutS
MAIIKDPMGIAALAGILVIVLIVLVVLAVRRSNQKRNQRINDEFGKAPEGTNSDINNINAYHTYYIASTQDNAQIDETTWNDLNMDDIFGRINACSSAVGEEYLYHILHELKKDKSHLEKRERLILRFLEEPKERLTAQKALLGIGKRRSHGLSYYIFHAGTKKLTYAWLLAALPVLGLFLMPFVLIPGLVLAGAAIVVNIAVYYFFCLRLEPELESMKSFSSLLFAAKALRRKMGHELNRCGYRLDDALRPFKKQGGLVPGRVRQTLAELEALTIIFKAVFLVDLVRYNHIINTMFKNAKELDALFCILGEIDVAISIASFRLSLTHYCTPTFHQEPSIAFREMYHPLIQRPVTNDAELHNDSIITGSNASGKSTFIKGIAVNNILAQTIYTCCALQYKLRPSYVATSMALRDNIVSGDSYFVTEIKSLKRIIDDAKSQYCTCFIDEILRGTNTPERLAASTAVLRMLHETDSLCIVASHDIELTQILEKTYDNYHFCEQIKDNEITFDYRLKAGPSRTTNAIKLLEYMGFEAGVVDEAKRLLKE